MGNVVKLEKIGKVDCEVIGPPLFSFLEQNLMIM